MFKSVTRIQYVVRNRDELVAYIERVFGMKPDKLADDYREQKRLERPGKTWVVEGPGYNREAHYRVGPTLVIFREPVPGSEPAQFLAKNGSSVFRVTWGVNNIPEVAEQLKAKEGVLLREDERGYHPDSSGPNQIDIDFDPEAPGALAVFFQLMEEGAYSTGIPS